MRSAWLLVFAAIVAIGYAAAVALAQPVTESKPRACSTASYAKPKVGGGWEMACPGECTEALGTCEATEWATVGDSDVQDCECKKVSASSGGGAPTTTWTGYVNKYAPCRTYLQRTVHAPGYTWSLKCDAVACKKDCKDQQFSSSEAGNVWQCICPGK